MKSKEQILSEFSKKNYKPCFLLAWLRYLTYNELITIDMLEPYDAALLSKQIKKPKDWDKNMVIKYNKENLLYSLCILMRKFNTELNLHNDINLNLYLDDIITWLDIMGDNEYNNINVDKLSNSEIIDIYNLIALKYKIEF